MKSTVQTVHLEELLQLENFDKELETQAVDLASAATIQMQSQTLEQHAHKI